MKLERMQNDPALFELLVIGCAVEEELEEAEAREYVLDMIQRTKGFLADDYDRIMKEIKHKINVYLQIAVGRARFCGTGKWISGEIWSRPYDISPNP